MCSQEEAGPPAAEAALRVQVAGFEAQRLPLRLRAGAPHTFTLLDGHPWQAQVCTVYQTLNPITHACIILKIP